MSTFSAGSAAARPQLDRTRSTGSSDDGPGELNRLLQQVQQARSNIEALRTRTRSLATNPEQIRLLESLERFVAALQARHLPVPPGIRDELTLQRCLVSRAGALRATRRQAGRR